MMSLRSAVVAQFARPSGILGAFAGRIMAHRASNRIRNLKTVDLMKLKHDSCVLEIGCGPGLALSRCATIVTAGRVVGVDHSGVMLRQAARRMRKGQLDQRIELIEGGLECLVDLQDSFDRVYSLNVIQFQPDKHAFFQAVIDSLKAGGLCLTTYQPRLVSTGSGSADRMADVIEHELRVVGCKNVTRTSVISGANPAICVIGKKPK